VILVILITLKKTLMKSLSLNLMAERLNSHSSCQAEEWALWDHNHWWLITFLKSARLTSSIKHLKNLGLKTESMRLTNTDPAKLSWQVWECQQFSSVMSYHQLEFNTQWVFNHWLISLWESVLLSEEFMLSVV
jgi:hypothetical protein